MNTKKLRSKSPRVIVTRKLPQDVEARLVDLFDATLNSDDTPMSQSDLKKAVSNCHPAF